MNIQTLCRLIFSFRSATSEVREWTACYLVKCKRLFLQDISVYVFMSINPKNIMKSNLWPYEGRNKQFKDI